jgi:hypothetical protein
MPAAPTFRATVPPWRVVRALAGLVLAASAVVLTQGAEASSCLSSAEDAERWHEIPLPHVAVSSLAQGDHDPCLLVAGAHDGSVWRSGDGGASWQSVLRTGKADVRVFTEDLGPGTAVVSVAGGSWISHDGASSFTAVAGLGATGGEPIADIRAFTNGTTSTYYAVLDRGAIGTGAVQVAVAGATPTVYQSDDAGYTYRPSAASATVTPTRVIVDPGGSLTAGARIWLNNVGGRPAVPPLLSSVDDNRTYQPVQGITAEVADLDLATLPDGTALLTAATSQGIAVTADRAATWTTSATGFAFSSVRVSESRPGRLTAVVNKTVVASSDRGRSLSPMTTGLPGSCTPAALATDDALLETHLLRCAEPGRYYRYRDSGASASQHGSGGGGGGDPSDPLGLHLTQMNILKTLRLPVSDRSSSGSLAFDGEILYYAGDYGMLGGGVFDKHIHKMDATTGLFTGDVPTDVAAFNIMYDARRHVLYAEDVRGMHQIDPVTGRSTLLFAEPGNRRCGQCNGTGTYAYDASMDLFWHNKGGDIGSTIEFVDRRGSVVRQCTYTTAYAAFGATRTNPNGAAATAAIAATGQGGAYIQDEDDQTVTLIDSSCRSQAFYTHRVFDESWYENDQVACDSTTFYPKAALWIRDSDVDKVVAYEVPYGYCPAPSALHVTPVPRGPAGSTVPVCVHLTALGSSRPIADRDVAIEIDRRVAGTARTNRAGVGCVSYTTIPAGAGTALSQTLKVNATFFGDRAYTSSLAHGAVPILGAVAPVGTVVRGAVPPLPAPNPPQQPDPQPQPRPDVQGNPVTQAQTQTQTQGQSQAQANPVAVAVPQPQAQVQVAQAQAQRHEYEMSRLAARHTRSAAGSLGLAVLAAGSVCGAAAWVARAHLPRFQPTRRSG